jgi:ubiquinone/menaquinone biosynthesis C-methylase UbiE
VDDLEVELVERYGAGKDVLECGCGTGLLLERFGRFARSARGIDLSPGMLEKARARRLDVGEGSVTALPFADATFDVTCAFKVLAHVPEVGRALAEMVRVTRPGGVVLAEFYNALSLRALVKWMGPAGHVSSSKRETDVFTRFYAPWVIPRLLPPAARLVGARGVRIVTPAAAVMRVPMLARAFRWVESSLADSKAAVFGGFYIAILRKADVTSS